MKRIVCAVTAAVLLAGCQSQAPDAAQPTPDPSRAEASERGTGDTTYTQADAASQRSEKPWSFNYVVPQNADSRSTLREEGARVAGVRFGTGGEFYIAANLRNKNGFTEVCGAWAQTDNQSAYTRSKLRLASRMVAQASVQYRAKSLVRNLNFMGEVAWADFDWGAPATCKLTQKPWRPEYATDKVQVRIPTAGAYQL